MSPVSEAWSSGIKQRTGHDSLGRTSSQGRMRDRLNAEQIYLEGRSPLRVELRQYLKHISRLARNEHK